MILSFIIYVFVILAYILYKNSHFPWPSLTAQYLQKTLTSLYQRGGDISFFLFLFNGTNSSYTYTFPAV